jgi:hypothetical protein
MWLKSSKKPIELRPCHTVDWARVAKLAPRNELSTHFLRAEKILLPMYQDRTTQPLTQILILFTDTETATEKEAPMTTKLPFFANTYSWLRTKDCEFLHGSAN